MRSRIFGAPLVLDAFAVGAGVVALAFLAADVLRCLQVVSGAGAGLVSIPAALGAVVVYALSHLLRAARLTVLLGPGRLSFGAVYGCHTAVALLTFAMPLKLGEVLRATELYRLAGGARGLFAVWLDRLFDVAVVLVLLAGFALRGGVVSAAALLSLAAFLLGSMIAVLVLPGALVALERALLHSSSRRSLAVLRAAVRLRDLLSSVPRVDRQTLSLLSISTFCVWGLELLTVFLVLAALPMEGRPLAGQAIDALDYALGMRGEPLTPQVALYRLLCQAALVIMAGIGLGSYLRARFHQTLRVTVRRAYRVAPPSRASRIDMRGRVR